MHVFSPDVSSEKAPPSVFKKEDAKLESRIYKKENGKA
jgi:hypothetical protein